MCVSFIELSFRLDSSTNLGLSIDDLNSKSFQANYCQWLSNHQFSDAPPQQSFFSSEISFPIDSNSCTSLNPCVFQFLISIFSPSTAENSIISANLHLNVSKQPDENQQQQQPPPLPPDDIPAMQTRPISEKSPPITRSLLENQNFKICHLFDRQFSVGAIQQMDTEIIKGIILDNETAELQYGRSNLTRLSNSEFVSSIVVSGTPNQAFLLSAELPPLLNKDQNSNILELEAGFPGLDSNSGVALFGLWNYGSTFSSIDALTLFDFNLMTTLPTMSRILVSRESPLSVSPDGTTPVDFVDFANPYRFLLLFIQSEGLAERFETPISIQIISKPVPISPSVGVYIKCYSRLGIEALCKMTCVTSTVCGLFP